MSTEPHSQAEQPQQWAGGEPRSHTFHRSSFPPESSATMLTPANDPESTFTQRPLPPHILQESIPEVKRVPECMFCAQQSPGQAVPGFIVPAGLGKRPLLPQCAVQDLGHGVLGFSDRKMPRIQPKRTLAQSWARVCARANDVDAQPIYTEIDRLGMTHPEH